MKYPQKNSFSRFVLILLVIVITIVAVAAVLAIGRALFGGDSTQILIRGEKTVDIGMNHYYQAKLSFPIWPTVRGPIVGMSRIVRIR